MHLGSCDINSWRIYGSCLLVCGLVQFILLWMWPNDDDYTLANLIPTANHASYFNSDSRHQQANPHPTQSMNYVSCLQYLSLAMMMGMNILTTHHLMNIKTKRLRLYCLGSAVESLLH